MAVNVNTTDNRSKKLCYGTELRGNRVGYRRHKRLLHSYWETDHDSCQVFGGRVLRAYDTQTATRARTTHVTKTWTRANVRVDCVTPLFQVPGYMYQARRPKSEYHSTTSLESRGTRARLERTSGFHGARRLAHSQRRRIACLVTVPERRGDDSGLARSEIVVTRLPTAATPQHETDGANR